MADKPIKNKKISEAILALVGREHITIYKEVNFEKVIFNYPENSVRDLEVVNLSEFQKALKESLLTHKISSNRLVMLLAPDIYFEKRLDKVSENEREAEIQRFLDVIPFVSVSSRQFRIGDNIQLIAINRTFYEAIHDAFVEAGLEVISVTPLSAIPGIDYKAGPSPEQCLAISKHPESAILNSFLTEENTNQDFSARKEKFLKKHQIILGGFSVLAVLVALATSVYTLQKPTPKTSALAAKPVAVSSPTPSLIPQPTLAYIRDPKEIKIRIVNASGTVGLAQKTKTELEKLGFSQIQVATATISADLTEAQIAEIIDPPLMSALQKWLALNYPDYRQTSSVSGNLTDHVVITLGKSN